PPCSIRLYFESHAFRHRSWPTVTHVRQQRSKEASAAKAKMRLWTCPIPDDRYRDTEDQSGAAERPWQRTIGMLRACLTNRFGSDICRICIVQLQSNRSPSISEAVGARDG